MFLYEDTTSHNNFYNVAADSENGQCVHILAKERNNTRLALVVHINRNYDNTMTTTDNRLILRQKNYSPVQVGPKVLQLLAHLDCSLEGAPLKKGEVCQC